MEYEMIIGLDLLNQIGVVIDFEKKTVMWEGSEVYMNIRTDTTTEELHCLLEKFQDPKSTHALEKHAIIILDVQYQKYNLIEISNGIKEVTPCERELLLKLLTKFEGLFDGTLGEFKTHPVSITVKKDAIP